MLKQFLNYINFCINTDRIGPDIFFTHWKLYMKSTMKELCLKKFKKFGIDSEFRPGAYAIGCSKIEIGDRVIIRPGSMLFGEIDPSENINVSISIANNVLIGCGVHIYVNNHRYDNYEIPIFYQGYYPTKIVQIKEGAWIGANSIILNGVTIGKNSVVGAGSIITKSVPDYHVVAGNPAKVLKIIKKDDTIQ
jgi:acetyltransferase-like isoleucine patch superfamily enzyme